LFATNICHIVTLRCGALTERNYNLDQEVKSSHKNT